MKRTIIYMALVLLLLQACSSNTPPATDAPTQAVSSETQTASATPVPEVSPTEAAPVTSSVNHTDIPSEGISDRATSHDHDNASTFETKSVRSGDEYFKNDLERPFTANQMEYLPDLDIVNFSITADDNFYYIMISLVGFDEGSQSLTGFYGVEIDRNADGRAELLLTAHPSYTEQFSADNVIVYMDENGDVGGAKINRPDDFESDGFETVVFDLDNDIHPSDLDFAWVRQTVDGAFPAIEFAFKKWIFSDGREAFMWSVDASSSELNPATFYLHDFTSVEEAGAANVEDPNYPIKAVSEFDNTCRVPLGVNVIGVEPLGCFVGKGETEERGDPAPDLTCEIFSALCEWVK
jgi:hypothetical protein